METKATNKNRTKRRVLSDEEVQIIRFKYKTNRRTTMRELASLYRVSEDTISTAINGKGAYSNV